MSLNFCHKWSIEIKTLIGNFTCFKIGAHFHLHHYIHTDKKFDVIQVKKNDNPFIIMTNYDQLEFFNLWIQGSTT